MENKYIDAVELKKWIKNRIHTHDAVAGQYEALLKHIDTLQKRNTWIKFAPERNLPKDRVTIAYETHDERKVRYAYGYFQFNPNKNYEFCGFAKDGNEQPKRVRTEDILYWKPLEALPTEDEMHDE